LNHFRDTNEDAATPRRLRAVDEPLGHLAISWNRWQVASDVAISEHRPLFTQTRQGLEKNMMSEEYDNLLLWGL
jgi:hypothetical protein